MTLAILQCADSGPVESLIVMLRAAGWQCAYPSEALKNALRDLGCDTVLDIRGLVRGMGYDEPLRLPEAGLSDMARADVVYVDVKAHRNGPKVWKRWPALEKRTLWYRINGGQPEHVIRRNADGSVSEDCGDEVNPPCPVLTPNQWYNNLHVRGKFNGLGLCCCCGQGPFSTPQDAETHLRICREQRNDWYTCWPPFYRFDEHGGRADGEYAAPVCYIHNINGWGYREVVDPMRRLGVKCHGAGSPDGLLQHQECKARLRDALCMVHLKSNDAPGYAIYEALATGCPLVCTRRLIWRSKMEQLLEPGVTCLAFDKPTHAPLEGISADECVREVAEHLARLKDPAENRRIGQNGRERLRQIMWSESRESDVASLKEFLTRNFV